VSTSLIVFELFKGVPFCLVTTLMEQGWVGMSEEEKKDFVAKVVEKVKT
jgi:hypothetical protein